MWGSQTQHTLQTDLHAIFIMRDTMHIHVSDKEILEGQYTIHNTCDTLCSEETEDEVLLVLNRKQHTSLATTNVVQIHVQYMMMCNATTYIYSHIDCVHGHDVYTYICCSLHNTYTSPQTLTFTQ